MASPSAILRAAQASQGARPGAAQPTPPPQGQWMGAYSPVALNASPGMQGYSPGYGPFLPRPPQDFTQGAFGPFSPILPVPVDQPAPGSVRPQPRRWQYPVGFNLPTGAPGSEGLKLAGFDQLKTLSRLYSILRTCIEIRKSEIRALEWDIVLTKDAAKAYKGDRAAMRDFGERRAKALKWFRKPDPDYFTFSSWLNTLLDQVFTIDALSLYMCPTKGGRRSGKGLLGSGLDSLWLVDGASVRPLVGLHGETPRPPSVAYEQYLYGVPRSDYMTMRDGGDLAEAGFTADDLAGQFRGDQLLYLPWLRQADTPYGFSMVERALIPIMTGLQKQAYQLNYFTEGTVPAVYISPGDMSMTPNQVRELQDALNGVAGDPAWHMKIIVLPPGSKTMPQKQIEIVDQADEWIATEVAMTCDVNPMELGVLPKVSTVASPFAAREMAQASRSIHQRISTKPTLMFFQEIFDLVLQDIAGQDDMRFLFSGMEEVQDQAAITDMGVKQVQSGIRSIDEFRDLLGLTPWDLDETSEPVVFTPMGPIPLRQSQALLGMPPGGPQSGGANGSGSTSSTLTVPTGAHAAAQGHVRAGSSANASGRPGSVTERQRSRGGSLAPQHAQGTGAPGRATGRPVPKAAAAELEALGRHLRKGRKVGTWQPVHLPDAVLDVVRHDLADGQPLSTAMADAWLRLDVLTKAAGAVTGGPKGQPPPSPAQIAALYGPQVAAAFAAAITAAAALIAAWIAGTLAVTAAVLAAMILAELRKHLGAVLDALWRAAWDAAAAMAQEQAGAGAGTSEVRRDLEAFLATEGGNWLSVISGTGEARLIQAIKDAVASGDPGALARQLEDLLKVTSRADLIAVTEVMRAWNAAALRVLQMLGVTLARWTVHSDNPCPRCVEAQKAGPLPLGSLFPGVNLPAPPAHPRCMCALEPAAVKAAKALTRHVAETGEVFWAEGEDGGPNAAGGGALLHPYPHNASGGPVPGGSVGPTAGGAPPRWDGSAAFPHDLSLPAGDDGRWGQAAGTGSRPGGDWPAPYMDGYWPEPHGHGTEQAPGSSPGAATGRPPNAVGKAADAAKFLATAPDVAASTVYRQLRANYPAESVSWVKRLDWHGPSEVPLAMFDWNSRDRWAAHHQQVKVDHFAALLQAREKVNPVIAILRPGTSRLVIIDGHHRALACRQIGWPVRAYVAVADGKDARLAEEAHLYQEHQGDDPANKSFTAGALGIPGAVSGLSVLATQPAMPNTPDALRKVSKKSVNYRPATSERERCDTCVMWAAGRCTLVKGDIAADAVCDRWYPRSASKNASEPYVSGLMVRAGDTGRVLMLQRAITEGDPAAGRWEPPGGHAEPGETLLQAALREWAEETGMTPPRGTVTGSWDASNGIYRGFVLTVPSEDSVPVFDGRDQVWDPDGDPHGDTTQAIAWFDPAQFAGNPSMRDEMQADLDRVLEALEGPVATKSAETPELEATPYFLGTEGLWHTPDRHVGERQKLPNYIEHVAHALMRDQGMEESQAIATAINAIKRWARGDLHWGHHKITPEVVAASQRALAEWEELRASHKG